MPVVVSEENKMFVCTETDSKGNITAKTYWNTVLDFVKMEVYEEGMVLKAKRHETDSLADFFETIKRKHGKKLESYVEKNRITVKLLIRKKDSKEPYKVEEVMPCVDKFVFPSSFEDKKSNYDYAFVSEE